MYVVKGNLHWMEPDRQGWIYFIIVAIWETEFNSLNKKGGELLALGWASGKVLKAIRQDVGQND